MLTIIIAGLCYAIGLFIRTAFAKNPHEIGILIAMNMFTILSPCGFIATVCILLYLVLLLYGANADTN